MKILVIFFALFLMACSGVEFGTTESAMEKAATADADDVVDPDRDLDDPTTMPDDDLGGMPDQDSDGETETDPDVEDDIDLAYTGRFKLFYEYKENDVRIKERRLSLQEQPDRCYETFEREEAGASKSRTRLVKLRKCGGFLLARAIRSRVGSCQPASVLLHERDVHAGAVVIAHVERTLQLDSQCLCYYQKEKFGITKNLVEIRKKFVKPDRCAEHFPEYGAL